MVKSSRRKAASSRFRSFFPSPGKTIAGLAAAAGLWLVLSPRPGAWYIRYLFNKDARSVQGALDVIVPSQPVASIHDVQYLPGDKEALLDVYFPENTGASGTHPTIVWTHGGAWLSGTKEHYAGYFKQLAADGNFTVVALQYSLAPEHPYPKALHQLNSALAYLNSNADNLHADSTNIILAGDSAGSQLSSQLAVLTTNPEYAAELQLAPGLSKEHLKGVILTCGVYDIVKMFLTHSGKPTIDWGTRTALRAYTNHRDVSGSTTAHEISTIHHVTENFPPAFITGGNGDGYVKQSKALSEKLKAAGVEVDELFYPEDHEPRLPHEYQFKLHEFEDATTALQRIVAFAQKQFSR